MREVSVCPGENIKMTAARLIDEAKQHGEVFAMHNGVRIVATPASTYEGLLSEWDRRVEADCVAYRNSPEGRRAEQERNARIDAARVLYATQMQALPALDFTDQAAVLDWLCAIQPATDHEAVTTNRAAILAAFAAHSLLPDVNCGAAYRKGDRDNEYRWLVGQALSTLKSVAIHGIVHKFAAEWKAKYAARSGT